MTNGNIIEINDVRTFLGGTWIHDGINLSIRRSEVLGIIGASGGGKTMLLREILDLTKPTSGTIKVFDKVLSEATPSELLKIQRRWGVLFQSSALFSSITLGENVAFPLKEHTHLDKKTIQDLTLLKLKMVGLSPEDAKKNVRENVEEGVAESIALIHRYNEISMKFAEPLSDAEMNKLLEEQGELQTAIDTAGLWELERKLEIAADALRLPPWEADVTKLSGGERRRVALCRLLISNPDMLLLDEPTNHLDAESIAWLERFLHEYPSTVVAVTHDRYFLDNVAGWILELDRGQGIPYEGNYSSWLEQKEKRLEQEERQQESHAKAIKAELEWVRSNPKGRHAKSKARLARFEELNSKEFQKRNETLELYIPPGPRLGDLVIETNNLSKRFGERVLFENLTMQIPPGAIVGIIGPNGAGKSTLFKMIMGQEEADSGDIRLGESVKLAYVDQSRDALKNENSVWQEISNGQEVMTIGNFQMPSRAYVGRFNFKGTDQQKMIQTLSGGERNRVHLAKLLSSGGNVLLLDEPTNDLDVETLRALEEALLSFPGCALIISHDRWFLDRIATHILAFEGDSTVEFFTGNYKDFEEDRIRRLGDAANQPHRIKYKKLHA